MFQHNVHRGATRQLGFGSAGQQNGGKPRGGTDARANAGAFGASRNCSNPRALRGCRGDRAHILAFVAAAGNLAFGVHGFFAAGVRTARRGVQIHGVAGRQDQRVQAHAEFAAPLDAAGTLRIDQFAAQIRADGNHDAVAHGDRKRSLQVHRIARLRAARGNPVLKYHSEARACGNNDFFARARLRSRRGFWRDDRWGVRLRSLLLLRKQRNR